MNAHDVLMYGHATFRGELDRLPTAVWNQPGACGVWSPLDIVAHLASYELVLVDILASFGPGGPTPHLDRFTAQGAAFNDREVEARRGRPAQTILDELDTAHRRTLELIAAIPAETIRRPGTLPWYGDAYALDDLIAYSSYGHKREHAAQIAAFRDRFA